MNAKLKTQRSSPDSLLLFQTSDVSAIEEISEIIDVNKDDISSLCEGCWKGNFLPNNCLDYTYVTRPSSDIWIEVQKVKVVLPKNEKFCE